ncbi:MAG: heterocyst frequency control protein PatD [Synechocystis sp.]|nr:heterocyst frequency control protein PatD [Synechocystis sp.]
MSSTLLFDFPDRLREFRQRVMVCQTAINQPKPDRPLVADQIRCLETIIQEHLLPLPLDAIPPHHQSLGLSIKTELQRTIRLLTTEFSFWQMARSGDRQQHYQKRLQHHCQQLIDFAQVMEQWLEPVDL